MSDLAFDGDIRHLIDHRAVDHRQRIDIAESIEPPLTWRDALDDACRYAWRVSVMVVLAAIVVGTIMAAVNPDTPEPLILWTMCAVASAILVYRFGQFITNP